LDAFLHVNENPEPSTTVAVVTAAPLFVSIMVGWSTGMKAENTLKVLDYSNIYLVWLLFECI
jgi:hypothetical protein